MTVREPEWDEQEQAWILALAEVRSWLCPCGCGQDRREAWDPAAEGKWRATVTRCHARTAISAAMKPYAESPQPEALLFGAELRRG